MRIRPSSQTNTGRARRLVLALALVGFATTAGAQTLVGPVAYQSEADIPAGFYPPGTTPALEDFEDCSLDFGITADVGVPIFNVAGGGCDGFFGIIDSVDGDDGAIDGSGSGGRSFFSFSGGTGITFTFPSLVQAAGVVWTDGEGTTTFEAFGPGMVSLGVIGPVAIANGTVTGETDEDRFFGVQHPDGILAIKLSNTGGGIEVDHVQYAGEAAAVPSITSYGWPFLLVASFATVWHTRRKLA